MLRHWRPRAIRSEAFYVFMGCHIQEPGQGLCRQLTQAGSRASFTSLELLWVIADTLFLYHEG